MKRRLMIIVRHSSCWHAMLTAFVFYLASSVTVQCNGQSLPEIKLKKGPINELAKEISSVVQLSWVGENIQLEKDVEVASSEERLEKSVQSWMQRGLDRERAERLAKQSTRAFSGSESPAMRAFNSIAAAAGPGGGRSSSGGGVNQRSSFSKGTLSGECQVSQDFASLLFTERGAPNQSFKISEEGLRFSFLFVSDDWIIRIIQNEQGEVRVGILGEEPYVYNAKSYRALCEKNPLLIKEVINPLFAHVGIAAPLSSDNEEVKAAVLLRVVAREGNTNELATQLVTKLESESEEVRKEAATKLAIGYNEWKAFLTEFADDENLSDESKKVLSGLERASSSNRTLTFVKQQKLMNSAPYLVQLLANSKGEAKEALIKCLTGLTEQDFGDDVPQWREWLKSKNN